MCFELAFTAQYHTIQYSGVLMCALNWPFQHSAIPYNTVWCDMCFELAFTAQCHTIQYSVVLMCALNWPLQCNTIPYNTVGC